jgi:hypothetical protein
MTDSDDRNRQAARSMALVTKVMRALGACFMLAAPLLAFDAGGIASRFGLSGMTGKILGGALFVMGLVDFFVMPGVLRQAMQKKSGSPEGTDSGS